jgi:hypothetical protein
VLLVATACAAVLTGLLAWAALRLLIQARHVFERRSEERAARPTAGPHPSGPRP